MTGHHFFQSASIRPLLSYAPKQTLPRPIKQKPAPVTTHISDIDSPKSDYGSLYERSRSTDHPVDTTVSSARSKRSVYSNVSSLFHIMPSTPTSGWSSFSGSQPSSDTAATVSRFDRSTKSLKSFGSSKLTRLSNHSNQSTNKSNTRNLNSAVHSAKHKSHRVATFIPVNSSSAKFCRSQKGKNCKTENWDGLLECLSIREKPLHPRPNQTTVGYLNLSRIT